MLQGQESETEHSVAREWNEVLLNSIRRDFARPTIHARNLFHISVAMYDAWAAYDSVAKPYFLGNGLGNYSCSFEGIPVPENLDSARHEAISYAAFKMLHHRFANSPNANETQYFIDEKMMELGYDLEYTASNYQSGNPADLGNYIAQEIISAGFVDGANEVNFYANEHYTPVNDDLVIENSGNNSVTNPNNWQPIFLTNFIDQGGNLVGETPEFLGPEWGKVEPFALSDEDKATFYRDGNPYEVYHDPGFPDMIDTTENIGIGSAYKWGFSLVSAWASHLDPSDEVMWDISPASIGNIQSYPSSSSEFPDFYNFEEGGDISVGHDLNPITGMPYETQMVPRGDYARVLAEFWADGPDSETPPGHWFEILNKVSDDSLLVKRWNGKGEILSDLEWDVKTYMTLGGTMHDAAVTAWGIKGWYDYIRPVSAIRYLAELGQSTDETLPNFHPGGIPLVPGFIEVVYGEDLLALEDPENIGGIKLYTWKGPDYINNPFIDEAGVDWIMAKDWWPYQRPSFVTPPFAGYVSGHSTYSRAAAEVMTLMTGDPYFPGGMGEFIAPKDQFLVFEDGPSVDIKLQWATYRDASDQCSLSRIWGGIHPPCDDIPGRLIGMEIGPDAFYLANSFFDNVKPQIQESLISNTLLTDALVDSTISFQINFDEPMDQTMEPSIDFLIDGVDSSLLIIDGVWLDEFTYQINYILSDQNVSIENIEIEVGGAIDLGGNELANIILSQSLNIDTENPSSEFGEFSGVLSDALAGSLIPISIEFSEVMDTLNSPVLNFSSIDPTLSSLSFDHALWVDSMTYVFYYLLNDGNETLSDIMVEVSGDLSDINGNALEFGAGTLFNIDTQNPEGSLAVNLEIINDESVGSFLFLNFNFSEPMNTDFAPEILFPNDNPLLNSLVLDSEVWWSGTTFGASFIIQDGNERLDNIKIEAIEAKDLAGNNQILIADSLLFMIDTENPQVMISSSSDLINDSSVAETFEVNLEFSESMDMEYAPVLVFENIDMASGTLNLIEELWIDNSVYHYKYEVQDLGEVSMMIDLIVEGSKDTLGNAIELSTLENAFWIEMENPEIQFLESNLELVENGDIGAATFSILAIFDEEMDQDSSPQIEFDDSEFASSVLTLNEAESFWINELSYITKYDVNYFLSEEDEIGINIMGASDLVSNEQLALIQDALFSIHIEPAVGIANSIENEISGRLYPNPVNRGEAINIDLGEDLVGEQMQIDIINLNGQTLYSKTYSSLLNSTLTLESSGFEAGYYFLYLRGEFGHEVLKIVVQ